MRAVAAALLAWACGSSPGGEESPAPGKSAGTLSREWLENMVRWHGYSREEVAAAANVSLEEAGRALAEHGLVGQSPPPAPPAGKVLVLPYPGGRHPRIGFLDGAIDPRRDTKASLFLPWAGAGYVVVDLPEALWSQLGLTFLAHTHIPTVWDQQGVRLPAGEWTRTRDGGLENAFHLPNGIRIASRVAPRTDAADLELRVRNGSAEKLTGLRAQVCLMLKGAPDFNAQTNDNKVIAGRVIATRSADGKRWIVTVWERARPWANPPCPCMHSDPTFPDLAPGEESVLRGRVFFWEGGDIHAEIARREAAGTLEAPAGRAGGLAGAELIGVERIWDQAPHSAFTDLVRWRDRWFCAFREGEGHVSPDGAIRILTSVDGTSWTSAARVAVPKGDLRDPKLAVAAGGGLQLSAASALRAPDPSRHQTLAWFSEDGAAWGEPIAIGEPDWWLWRIAWHAGAAYGVGYPTAGGRGVRFYRSAEGRKFETAATDLFPVGEPNETSLVFLDGGECVCLLRRDDPGGNGQLGRAKPPYTEWTWKDIGVRIGGPHFIRLADGRLAAAVRLHEPEVRTALGWIDAASGRFGEFLALPSGGDTSYAGLVEHGGLLWVSYYSSHQGKTSIYLARVKLPAAGEEP